jgi:hypothetical protein
LPIIEETDAHGHETEGYGEEGQPVCGAETVDEGVARQFEEDVPDEDWSGSELPLNAYTDRGWGL